MSNQHIYPVPLTRRTLVQWLAAALPLAVGGDGSAHAQAGPEHPGNGIPVDPTAKELKHYQMQWIDPIREGPAETAFALFPTPSRGVGTQGSYRIYLPPNYASDSGPRYPVIYWLHGGFGSSREGAPAVAKVSRFIRAGLMPPVILVLPQALPSGWYCDSKDGARPIEQVIVYDLVNHIDSTYRTRAESSYRWLEGMSMGGFGTLHLGLKHPEVFGRLSAVAPAILHDMALEPAIRTADTFFGDEAYFRALGPWTLALANAPRIRRSSKLRVLSGGADTRLVAVLREFDANLKSLDIPHEFVEVPGAGHDYQAITDGLGDKYADFWRLS
jgi:enterochelin esterase-like enzyme